MSNCDLEEYKMSTEDLEHEERMEWKNHHSLRINENQMWIQEQYEAGAKMLAIHIGVTQHADNLKEYAQVSANKLAQIEKYSLGGLEEKIMNQLSHEMMREMHNNQELKHDSLRKKHQEIISLVKRLYEAIQ